jgi:tetratricopeptide (TPR) repeat protein
LQGLLEHRLLDARSLAEHGRHQEAIDVLQVLLEENRHRDKEGWLEWAVLSQQASILAEEGRLAEALAKYRTLSGMRPPNLSESLLNRISLFDTLDAMGDAEHAIAELEIGLDSTTGVAIPTALMAFARYAQIAARDSIPVPVRYKALLKDVLHWWGIDVPDDLFGDPVSLGPAIVYAHNAHRQAAMQFQELEQEAWLNRETIDRERAIVDRLRQFAQNSPVRFFRQKALEILTVLQS